MLRCVTFLREPSVRLSVCPSTCQLPLDAVAVKVPLQLESSQSIARYDLHVFVINRTTDLKDRYHSHRRSRRRTELNC